MTHSNRKTGYRSVNRVMLALRDIYFFLATFPSVVLAIEPNTAAPVQAVAPHKMSGFMELGGAYENVSGDNPTWNDQYLRGNVQLTPNDRINGEISRQEHWGDRGVFFGANYTRTFNPDWYGSLSIGSATGGFFLPDVRVDGFLYHKWLEKKNFVTGLGFTYYKAKQVYDDKTAILDFIYYFDSPFILEIGGRFNQSDPGGISSQRGFLSVTYGKNKHYYITLHLDGGNQAYQLVGNEQIISAFDSGEAALIWRQWVTQDIGINFMANHYRNPFYNYSGFALGVFADF